MVKEVCTDTNQTQTQFANSMSDRRMEALQILNTLCTLPLEKMNTFLLTCLYLSFTLYTHFLYFPLPNPITRPHPPEKLTFYNNNNNNCILFYILDFCNQTAQFVLLRVHDFCERLHVHLHTVFRETTRPEAAVHCLEQTCRQTQTNIWSFKR